jgi:hypothetical protein
LRVLEAEECKRVRDFVNRSRERRHLGTELANDVDGRQLLLVVGEPEVGKSGLLTCLVEALALRGEAVRYVDLNGSSSINFLQVLRLIRDGSASPIAAPLPEAAFDDFNHRLNHWLAGAVPPSTRPPGPVVDAQLPLTAGPENLIPRLFDAFRVALVEAARAAPLVIALDHLGRVQSDDVRDRLRPLLFQPIARRMLPSVRMVLAVTDDEERRFELQSLSPPDKILRLGQLRGTEFRWLAEEFLRVNGSLTATSRELLQVLAVGIEQKPGWKPSMLRTLQLLIRQAAGT